ncbi:putative uncharacterized protein BRD3OS, partial [Silurus meridionalis]|uniref:putative uncharacterized protein BRD3OS n=1 Tax=Silurus meridionalis TaxID=175797 RepID=UPI001EEA3031
CESFSFSSCSISKHARLIRRRDREALTCPTVAPVWPLSPDPTFPPHQRASWRRDSLAEKAMSEGFARLRYKDTSLLIWQQQQQELERTPTNYLQRSRSTWYSQYGNQAVVVRDKNTVRQPDSGSRICSVM